MRIFVAGATGVIGLPTVRQLRAAGHQVTGVARDERGAAALAALGARPVTVDLFDADDVRAAVAGHDAVVNLATSIPTGMAATKPAAWQANHRLRSVASGHLVDAALAAGAHAFVQESIAFAYDDGGDAVLDESAPLGDSAWAPSLGLAEAGAARFSASGGRGIVLRFGGLYDGRSAHTQQLLAAARRGVSLDVGRHDAYFPTIAADDAAAAVVSALAGAPAGTYNVVDDVPMTRRQQAAAWSAAVGRRVHRLPQALVRLAPLALPLTTRSMRVSNRRLREATAWRPRHPSLREALVALVDAEGGPVRRFSAATRAGLSVLLLTGLLGGLWAQFAPLSFFEDFPLGRGWVAADGPYNEHLVRDYGGLNLALAVVTTAALASRRPTMATTAALAWLAFGVPHLTYHLHHLDLYDGIDVAGNVVGTASTVGAAALVLALPQLQRRRPRPVPAATTGAAPADPTPPAVPLSGSRP